MATIFDRSRWLKILGMSLLTLALLPWDRCWVQRQRQIQRHRHGICRMFNTSKILKFSNSTREKGVNRHFLQNIENLLWSNFQFLCNHLLNFKLTPSILWKILPKFGKFHKKEMFSVNSWQSYPSPKIFYTSSTRDIFHVSKDKDKSRTRTWSWLSFVRQQ